MSSLRLRSDWAQLVMRLQSWILASREAAVCSWELAQLSLARMASSASWKTGLWTLLCRVLGGRVEGETEAETEARAGLGTGIAGAGVAGGGREPLSPVAAPSQCSGLGRGTDPLPWRLLGPLFRSAGWDGAEG